MNIYVPEDLKRRMDEVEGVAWSPIACRAFEAKLAELIRERGVKNMKDVAARLRESKRKTDDVVTKRGRLDGRTWAENEAEAEELQRLEVHFEAMERNNVPAFYTSPGDTYNEGEHFVFSIRPDADRKDADGFWEGVLGDDAKHFIGDATYVQAFAEGALEVWIEVQDQL